MSVTVVIRDQSTGPSGNEHRFELTVPTESLTVRELIRERVYQEVDDHNRAVRTAKPPARYFGLVQPSRSEAELNGPLTGPVKREIDWRKQFELATEAFESRRFLLFVGDRQAETLDETVRVDPGTEVTFLKLVMLVGG